MAATYPAPEVIRSDDQPVITGVQCARRHRGFLIIGDSEATVQHRAAAWRCPRCGEPNMPPPPAPTFTVRTVATPPGPQTLHYGLAPTGRRTL